MPNWKFRHNLCVASFAIYSLALAGCDVPVRLATTDSLRGSESAPNYELLEHEGKLVRLNKVSGEIVEFTQSGIKKYDDHSIQDLLSNEADVNQLKRLHATLPGSDDLMYMDIAYKWRNDKLLIQVGIGPFDAGIDNARKSGVSSIFLLLTDEDGFDLKTVELPMQNMSRTVDDKGSFVRWDFADSVSLNKEDFLLARSWNYKWTFDEKLTSAVNEAVAKLRVSRDELVKDISRQKCFGAYESLLGGSLRVEGLKSIRFEATNANKSDSARFVTGIALSHLLKAHELYKLVASDEFDKTQFSLEMLSAGVNIP